jgi:hypothetical protein
MQMNTDKLLYDKRTCLFFGMLLPEMLAPENINEIVLYNLKTGSSRSFWYKGKTHHYWEYYHYMNASQIMFKLLLYRHESEMMEDWNNIRRSPEYIK